MPSGSAALRCVANSGAAPKRPAACGAVAVSSPQRLSRTSRARDTGDATISQRWLAELRAIQDWFVRYLLPKAQGVSEVASVGGSVKTFRGTVDPQRPQTHEVTLRYVFVIPPCLGAERRPCNAALLASAAASSRGQG